MSLTFLSMPRRATAMSARRCSAKPHRRGKVRGAKFVKLEVDLTNAGGARFYERLGFKKKLEDRLFILEQDGLNNFIAERVTP